MSIKQISNGRTTVSYKCSTKFGEWMAINMCDSGYSIRRLADLLRINERTIRRHINGTIMPTFVDILAYCWAFDSDDDPDTIYELIKEEL